MGGRRRGFKGVPNDTMLPAVFNTSSELNSMVEHIALQHIISQSESGTRL
jgi:hypothetical protein